MTVKPKTPKAAPNSRKKAKPRSKPKSTRRPTTKLDKLATMLARANGASIVEMAKATGWQAHSVRGALADALKKRGLAITSEKIDGVRRYQCTGTK